MDLSFIPIGAYAPRYFMKPYHINPEEAVIAHQDLRSKVSVAVHYGTFPLAAEGIDEPVSDLRKSLHKYSISSDEFQVMEIGVPKFSHCNLDMDNSHTILFIEKK